MYIEDKDSLIAELTESNHSLRKSNQELEDKLAIFQHFFNFYLEYGQDGQVKYVNEGFYGSLGYSQELLVKNIEDFFRYTVHPDDYKIFQKALGDLKSGKTIWNIQTRFRCKNNSYKWFSLSAAPLTQKGIFYIVGRDITRKRKTEKTLKEQERFLTSVFESIKDIAYVVDDEFNIIQANSQTELEYAGAMPLIGKTCYEVFYNNKGVCRNCPAVLCLQFNRPTEENMHHFSKNGMHKWYNHRFYPFMDIDSNQVKGVIVYAKDITESLKVEEEMSRLGRLKLIGQMAAGIGHEIRNPMTAVRGLLQVFLSKKEYENYKESLNLMITELDRANSIVMPPFVKTRKREIIR